MARWTSEELNSLQGKGKKKKKKAPGPGANQATSDILNYLPVAGFYAWRNNTTGIFDLKIAAAKIRREMPELSPGQVNRLTLILSGSYRKHNGILGVSDIIGLERRTGAFLGIEVKVGSDRPSTEQEQFIKTVLSSNGYGLFAGSANDARVQLDHLRKLRGEKKK